MNWRITAFASALLGCIALLGCGSTTGVPPGDPGQPAPAGDTIVMGDMVADVVSAAGFNLTPLISGQNAVYAYTAMWGSEITRLVHVDPRAKIAYSSYQSGEYEIYTMNEDGTEITQITDIASSTDDEPSWSPDASQIAFASSLGGDDEIAIIDIDGTNKTKITSNSTYSDSRPSWSPDGEWIAYHSNRDGDFEIYKIRPDGTDRTQLTSLDSSDEQEPDWSPDGQWIAYYGNADGDEEIYKMRADGSTVTQLTSNTDEDGDPAWSPDGSRIAFYSDRDVADYNIWAMDSDGGNVTQLTDATGLDSEPDYSPDGNMIAFESSRNGDSEIFIMSSSGSGETQLTFNSVSDRDPVWSPAPGIKRAYIGSAGTDGGEDPPFDDGRPMAVVGIGPAGTDVHAATVVMSEGDWPSLSVEALEGTGIYLAGMTMTGDNIKAILEDRGRGLPARNYGLRDTPTTKFVVIHFDALSGGIRSVLAGADTALAVSDATMTSQGLVIRGQFTEAYDARDPSRNLVNGLAGEILLDQRTGEVLAVN